MQQLGMHTVGRHRLGPEHVQNSTPETWSHPNTMRASGARALGGMFCNARVTHTAKLCTKDTGAKKQVLGQKSLCWTRKSHIGTLLPGDVNLHYCRQIEVDAWTDGSAADRQTGRQTDRQAGIDGKVPLTAARKPGWLDRKNMVLGNYLC